jgi:hypothetical protein
MLRVVKFLLFLTIAAGCKKSDDATKPNNYYFTFANKGVEYSADVESNSLVEAKHESFSSYFAPRTIFMTHWARSSQIDSAKMGLNNLVTFQFHLANYSTSDTSYTGKYLSKPDGINERYIVTLTTMQIYSKGDPNQGFWFFQDEGASNIITVTNLAATYIEGTFSGTLIGKNWNTNEDSSFTTITNGKFKLPVKK